MEKRILLVEPYRDLIALLGFFLEELGYCFDVASTADFDEKVFTTRCYRCVLINVDQNSGDWRDVGLRLAETASKLHVPVVMIADHKVDAATVAAKGWKPISEALHDGKTRRCHM